MTVSKSVSCAGNAIITIPTVIRIKPVVAIILLKVLPSCSAVVSEFSVEVGDNKCN